MENIADLTDNLVAADLSPAAEEMLASAMETADTLVDQLPVTEQPKPESAVIDHIQDLAQLFPPNMCKMTILAEYLRRGLAD